MNSPVKVLLLLVALAGPSSMASAGTVEVSSLAQLAGAIDKAEPSDRIVVADGRYTSTIAIRIARAGTAEKPIVIEAKTVGGAEIRGEAGFVLERPAAYVVVKGFVFTHKAGSMRIGDGVHHCRVTRNLFELQVDGRGTYLSVFGDDNEIDHNTFRNKKTEGQMVYVQGPGRSEMARRTWVHHNAFLDFERSRRNNSTGLHIGSSYRSMSSAFSVAEYNLFVRNVGENEGAVCNKSCDNVYRYNTIVDSTELSLRHGHRCQVYGNFLINSGGVRFFGHDHVIYSNYFERCRPAVSIGNGGATIPPGSLQSHQRPDRVKVVYNTLVNNRSRAGCN
jgi:poly(beta-D-mannuronate) lyase